MRVTTTLFALQALKLTNAMFNFKCGRAERLNPTPLFWQSCTRSHCWSFFLLPPANGSAHSAGPAKFAWAPWYSRSYDAAASDASWKSAIPEAQSQRTMHVSNEFFDPRLSYFEQKSVLHSTRRLSGQPMRMRMQFSLSRCFYMGFPIDADVARECYNFEHEYESSKSYVTEVKPRNVCRCEPLKRLL